MLFCFTPVILSQFARKDTKKIPNNVHVVRDFFLKVAK
jgi:hypothetical protein